MFDACYYEEKGDNMQKGVRIRMYVTSEQKRVIDITMKGYMSAYNYARGYHLSEYRAHDAKRLEYINSLEGKTDEEIDALLKQWDTDNKIKTTNTNDIRKAFNKHIIGHSYYEDLFKQGCLVSPVSYVFKFDYGQAHSRFVDGIKNKQIRGKQKKGDTPLRYPEDYGFPQKKSKGETMLIGVNPKNIDRQRHRINMGKVLGWVRLSSNQEIPPVDETKKAKYVRITTDGINYFLSFPYDTEDLPVHQQDKRVLGCCIGQEYIATLSDGTTFENITKSDAYNKLLEKKKSKQRKIDWLVNHSPKSYMYKTKKDRWKHSDSRQRRKLLCQIRKIEIKLNNMKDNWRHNICEQIIRKCPKGVVVQELKVKEMMRETKKMGTKLQQTGLYTFKETLEWHCKKHHIPFQEVENNFKSSQICHKCGTVNEEMQDLKNRTFTCSHCGETLHRSLNNALNLENKFDILCTSS